MKHNWKITAIILLMFLITQFIGLYVIHQYSPVRQTILNNETGQAENITFYPTENQLPYGIQPPQEIQQNTNIISIILSFVVAIAFLFLLMKLNFRIVLKIWFLAVVILAMAVSFNAFLKNYLMTAWIVSLIFAIPLAYFKVFRPNAIVHNLTELFIYPGIAAIFVPILNYWSILIFLVLIAIYDVWAVWKSGVMQKMAKYQMEKVGILAGFLIPHASRKVKEQIRLKGRTASKKIRIQLAILGGGDVAFPLVTAGVFLRAFGIIPALFVIFGAFLGLGILMFISQKKKFYPAMLFITPAILIGLGIWKLFFNI
jgi:presenilin-like A22 family membrane protease